MTRATVFGVQLRYCRQCFGSLAALIRFKIINVFSIVSCNLSYSTWLYQRLLVEFGVLVFFTKGNLMKFLSRFSTVSFHFLILDSFRWFRMRNLCRNLLLMLMFLKFEFWSFSFSTIQLRSSWWCIVIYVETIIYSNYNRAFYLWQQFELTSVVEYDLQETVKWCRKCFANFKARKTQFIWITHLNNFGAIHVKMHGSVL